MAFYSRDGFSCQCNIKNKCDGCNGKYIMPTKGDQIRTMTDEKLADLIANACDYICKGTSCPLIRQNGITCEDRVLEWLRQECER